MSQKHPDGKPQTPVMRNARPSRETRGDSLLATNTDVAIVFVTINRWSDRAPKYLPGPLESFHIATIRFARFFPVSLEESHFQKQEFHLPGPTFGSAVHQLLDYHLSLRDLLHAPVLPNFNLA